MPSPYPGMNPFLEQEDVWHDFHQHFCVVCVEHLVPQVRPDYIVTLGEHVHIHEPSAEERMAPALAWFTPVQDVERLSYVEIRDRMSREVVTVIKLLSPTDKEESTGRVAYMARRQNWLTSPVHFVEIDLLRGGPRMPMEGLPECDYYAMVARVEESPLMGIWPIRLRDPLPTIPIPLRAPDRDIRLDLRAVLDRVYDAAGYADYIDTGTPQPSLGPEDAEWARRVVAEAT